MPSQEIKTKNPLGASDEHLENFAAAFTKYFYAFIDRPDAKERMDEMEIKLKARGILREEDRK